MSAAIQATLERFETQRREAFEQFEDMTMSLFWLRPRPEKWSIGENIEHAQVLTRFTRRLLRAFYPLLIPVAQIRRTKPYETVTENPYVRPNFPRRLGFIWPPTHHALDPISPAEVWLAFDEEQALLQRFLADKDEAMLGHMRLWDPVIGSLNFIQWLDVAAHHEAHHFEIALRIHRDFSERGIPTDFAAFAGEGATAGAEA